MTSKATVGRHKDNTFIEQMLINGYKKFHQTFKTFILYRSRWNYVSSKTFQTDSFSDLAILKHYARKWKHILSLYHR